MVQILPLVGAAALLAQTALAAVVPARRSYGNSYNSNNNNNNYNSGNSYNSGSQQSEYQQSENQYGSNHGSDSNSYNVGSSNQYGSNSNSYNVGSSNQYGSNSYNSGSENQYGSNSYNSGNSNNNNNYNQDTTVLETSLALETAIMTTTTSSMMAEQTNTVLQQEVTTTAASYSMPSYGSGSNSWNNGYNNCVQQCMAQFGSPSSSNSSMESQQAELPPPTGTGAVHTIMVAPDGAGLRYVPFAVNASIGDTIRYIWTTPNNHTATLSSELAICNKSGIADQRHFASGVRNASAGVSVFDVTVQTSDPQFFYCSVAQHCEKGMFGIINPSNDIGAANTVGTMMSSLMASNPQLQAAYSYMTANISGTGAENWGMGMSLAGIPESSYPEVAANVLFTQGTFALNPGMLESNEGASTPDGSPIQYPSSLNVLLSDTSAATPSSTPANDGGYGGYGYASEGASAATPTGSLTPVNAVASGAMAGRSLTSAGMMVASVIGMAGWLLI